MGKIYLGIHQEIALHARDQFELDTLVETGTYSGETAFWAKDKFRRVISIELSPEFFRQAEERVNNASNVLLIQGDSRDWLGPICRGRCHHPTLFWLDAHDVNESGTYDPKGLSLMDEIGIINETFFGPHAIMVDDYYELTHKFGVSHETIVTALEDRNRHDRKVAVLDDVYIACPYMPENIETWRKNKEG